MRSARRRSALPGRIARQPRQPAERLQAEGEWLAEDRVVLAPRYAVGVPDDQRRSIRPVSRGIEDLLLASPEERSDHQDPDGDVGEVPARLEECESPARRALADRIPQGH